LRSGDSDRKPDDDRRVAERKEKADVRRAPALVHEFARDVVDRRNVIGVHGVAEAEGICQQGRPKQHRMVCEHEESQSPRHDVQPNQEHV